MDGAGLALQDLDLILINEAAPVIGDVAMETITETVVTRSTMIGHNPATPGGIGLGVGKTVLLDILQAEVPGEKVMVVVPASWDFALAAQEINRALARGIGGWGYCAKG